MATVKENLIAAKALIDTPEKWNQGSYHAGGFHGFDRHCSLGAILVATPNFDERDQMRAALLGRLTPEQRRQGHSMSTFNDEHTHAEVMAWWDRAIAAQDGTP